MSRQLLCSATVDLRTLEGKPLKAISALVRSSLILEHGFQATKGMTDKRLKEWRFAIRFYTKRNRDQFLRTLKTAAKALEEGIVVRKTTPSGKNPKRVRFLRQ